MRRLLLFTLAVACVPPATTTPPPTERFEDGRIYNGENGKTYDANISLQPDGKLRLRGFVGTPMFGETQVWTRVN